MFRSDPHSKPIRLDAIADVSGGYTLRGRDAGRAVGNGPHFLRISDLDPSGFVKIDRPNPIRWEPEMERWLLRPGDVLLANRGSRGTAAVFEGGVECVAGGQLFLIRRLSDQVVPAYLAWFLNQPHTQASLLHSATGTYVSSIAIGPVRELMVPLPPVGVQEKIAAVAGLIVEEQRLLAEILEHRRFLTTHLLGKAIQPFSTQQNQPKTKQHSK